jgi:hypothetical protein
MALATGRIRALPSWWGINSNSSERNTRQRYQVSGRVEGCK